MVIIETTVLPSWPIKGVENTARASSLTHTTRSTLPLLTLTKPKTDKPFSTKQFNLKKKRRVIIISIPDENYSLTVRGNIKLIAITINENNDIFHGV